MMSVGVAKMKDKLINSGWHHSYGWLRRPEMDTGIWFCYEEPDGDLIYTDDPRHTTRAFLNCWEDKKTGECYLAFSKIPIRPPRKTWLRS